MEIELKIGLTGKEDWDRLLRALPAPRETRVQRNIFLDGSDRELQRAEAALRVRAEAVRSRDGGAPRERLVLTLKQGEGGKADVFERAEHECPLELELQKVLEDPSALLRLDLGPIRELKKIAPQLGGLKVLGGFENYRCVIPVKHTVTTEQGTREAEFVWEVDRTAFPGGRAEYEAEIEVPDTATARALCQDIYRRLDDLGVRRVPRRASKFARFLRYAGDR